MKIILIGFNCREKLKEQLHAAADTSFSNTHTFPTSTFLCVQVNFEISESASQKHYI